ncbi:Pex19 protein family-domain-containing protein [Xylaria nigripes]|nr:Pex19 protein family-domain-containing protein [Xylaria nigripes]
MNGERAGMAGDKSKQTGQAPSAELKTVVPVNDSDDARDPDEDDLDDLDDMLDDFSAVNLNPQTTVPKTTASASVAAAAPLPPAATAASAASAASTSARPADDDEAFDMNGPIPGLDGISEEEFEKQLQAGMAELMDGLEGSSDIQTQFENIFKELGAQEPDSAGPSASAPKPAQAAATELGQDASFQDTIRQTMARMQASGDQATAAATAEGSEDDFIAEMMKAMKDMPGGEGNDEDFSKLLMGMMEQLTNKEILYEPMRELNEKFPAWMDKNRDTLAKDDLKRYQEQQVLVAEMVAKFEESTYSDSNVADREYIVDRMQKMQAAGSPPHDLVGEMPSAKEVLDAPEESCAPQ